MNTTASKHESLFYEIQNAADEFALTLATAKIPSVASEGSPEYSELIQTSGEKWASFNSASIGKQKQRWN